MPASSTSVVDRVDRADVELPLTEEQLQLHAAEVELRKLRAKVQALEGAIRTTAKVLAPYAGDGTGR